VIWFGCVGVVRAAAFSHRAVRADMGVSRAIACLREQRTLGP
jgi:hypothetical protein